MKCPMCNGYLTEVRCNICGYDQSLDYELYPTLQVITSEIKTIDKILKNRIGLKKSQSNKSHRRLKPSDLDEYELFKGYREKIYNNGDSYSGMWEAGHKHGEGKMIYANGDVYRGEWKYGVRHGYGIMEFSNGDKYEGNWAQNKKEGSGKFVWSDGTKYIGHFSGGEDSWNRKYYIY